MRCKPRSFPCILNTLQMPIYNRNSTVFAIMNAPGAQFLEAIKIFQNPTVHRFCVLPPLKNHPPKAIGFVYSPLWKITHQSPSVLCTPPFEKSPMQSPLVLCTPPFEKSPIRTHRFCVLPPLKNHGFWWALISGWAFISANTVVHGVVTVRRSNNKFRGYYFYYTAAHVGANITGIYLTSHRLARCLRRLSNELDIPPWLRAPPTESKNVQR